MKQVKSFVEDGDWHLHVWRVRYGTGSYAMLAPSSYHTNMIPAILADGDIPAMSLEEYLEKEGHWLPITKHNQLEVALQRLDEKLREKDSWWNQAVYEVFDRIIEVNDYSYGLSSAVGNKDEILCTKYKY